MYVFNKQNSCNIEKICILRENMSIPLLLHLVFIGKQLYNLLFDVSLCKVSRNWPTKRTIQTEIPHQQNVAAQK